MKKRIINVILSFLLLISLLPMTAVSAEKKEEPLPQGAAQVVEQDTIAPAGYESSTDPYGIDSNGATKVISRQEEILLSKFTGGKESNGYKTIYIPYDTFKDDTSTDNFPFDFNTSHFEYTAPTTVKQLGEIYYTSSVGFDGDGDGLNEKAAYIGLRWEDKHVVTWYVDSTNNYVSPLLDLGSAGWMYDFPTLSLAYKAYNFMKITAGDYHNSGKDTLFVYMVRGEYANEAWMDPVLFEVKLDDHGGLQLYNGVNLSSFFNDDYMANNYMRKDSNYENQLAADLATGDFNGDGIDDLAVISYLSAYESKYQQNFKTGLSVPMLAIGYGSNTGLNGQADSKTYVMGAVDSSINPINGASDLLEYYQYPLAPTITSGDIDHDGNDEIVAAGYYSEVYDHGKFNHTASDYSRHSGANRSSKLAIFGYEARLPERGLVNTFHQSENANEWTAGGTWVDDDYVLQALMTKTAHLDGPANPEQVLINGSIYEYSGNMLRHAYTPRYFTADDNNAYDKKINVTFMNSVIGTNVNGNGGGFEQFVYTVGLKSESDNHYTFYGGIIGKNGQKDNRVYYASSVNSKNEDIIIAGGSDPWANVTAVDNDFDALRVKYNHKTFAWADPEVIAVLQAAPYFGELGSFDDFNDGETAYAISTSYESEDGKSHSHSLGIGLMAEFDAEVLEMEVRLGYAGEWSSNSFITKGTSTTFEIGAGGNDTVILKRTPIIEFAYDVYDNKTHSWKENGHHSWVTRENMYYSMSIDDYNSFVKYYNKNILDVSGKGSEHFGEINKTNAPSLIGNEGNPYAYTENLEQVLATSVPLSYNGGTTSITFEESNGKGKATEEMHGFTYESSIVGGGLFKGGAYADTEHKWGHNKTVTETNGLETSGTVCNIDEYAIADALGITTAMVRQYAFNWTFGTWNLDLKGAGVVPVYGYKTSDVSSPSPRVDDLAYTLSDDAKTITLNWTKPSLNDGNPNKIDGYYVYMAKENGEYTRLNEEVINKTTYTINNFDRTKNYKFVVRTAYKRVLPAGGFSYYEGINSNAVVHNGDLSGKSSYEIAVENGFKGSEIEWLQSLVGPEGPEGKGISSIQKTGSSGLVDTYTIYYSDNSYKTFTITNGKDGDKGQNAEQIELQVINGTIQWKYDNEDNSAWRDLLTLEGNNITIQGLQGHDGLDGREIEINKNNETQMIEWRYVGESGWKELMPISELKGNDGRDVEFKIENGHLKWRYVREEIDWTTIGTYEDLIPNLDKSKYVEFNAGGGKLKWRYLSSSSDFIDSNIAKDKVPVFTKAIKAHKVAEGLEWRYFDNSNGWTKLNLSEAEIANLDLTKYIVANYDHDNLYIKYLDVMSDWTIIKTIEQLTGYANSIVELRTRNENILEYSAINSYEWNDIGVVSDIKGEDGKDGREIELRVNKETTSIEWQYKGENHWTKLIDLAEIKGLDGQDGKDGRSIVKIAKTKSEANIDTYTISYSDGSSDSFTITNGIDGEPSKQGIQGLPGEKGDKGDKGDKGEQGEIGDNGKQGPRGESGRDGQDGVDGLTPYIGENGHWFIAEEDTGVNAVAVSVKEISVNDEGKFIFTMTDGTEQKAEMPDGSDAGIDSFGADIIQSQVKTQNLALIGVILAIISLLWNTIALIYQIMQNKKQVAK